MFLELTTDGQPMLVNIETVSAVRPLQKGEGDNTAHKTLVLFTDETGYYVDQFYKDIAAQVPHIKIVTGH